MKRLVICFLLFTVAARADTLLSNLQICSLSTSGCSFLPLSSVPTIGTNSLVNESGELFFIFAEPGQTFSPPSGQTWTLDINLAWDSTSVSRSITFMGGATYAVAFDIGIPDTTLFPPPPALTLFTLDTDLTSATGATIASATNEFNVVFTVAEPATFVLLGAGLMSLLVGLHRKLRT